MAKATKSKQVGQTSAVLTDEMKLVDVPEISQQEEVKDEAPVITEAEVLPTPEADIFEKEPLRSETIEIANHRIFLAGADLSKEERIINFMATRPDGEVKLNDFLKTLYPLPTHGEPAIYLRQGESRALRGLLTKMQQEGKILFADNQYRKLGDFYYVDGDIETKYHTILTVTITAKK